MGKSAVVSDSVPAAIEIAGVLKGYPGMPPLRIARLTVGRHDRVVLSGFDAAAAELFVNLITGAAVPDEGDVRVAGHNTRQIRTDTEWLASLDRFGIVTGRAVLLEQLTIAANLALPITLAIDPLSAEVRSRVERLADDVGLARGRLDAPASTMSRAERVRAHLARALAPNPQLLLLEHPTTQVTPEEAAGIGATLERISTVRGLGWVALTDDLRFIRASGGRHLRLDTATGELGRPGLWSRILR